MTTPEGSLLPGLRRRLLPASLTALVLLLVVEVQRPGRERYPRLVIAAVLGLAMIAAVRRRPAIALGALVVYLPFQLLLPALLFHYGVPASAVRLMGALKDGVVLGLVVHALTQRAHQGERAQVRRLDTADVLGLAYLGWLTLALLRPALVGAGVAVPFSTRLLAWRADGLLVIVFLAARRIRLRPGDLRMLVRCVLGVAVLVAAGAVVEIASPKAWDSFIRSQIHVFEYKQAVLAVTDVNISGLIFNRFADVVVNRAGSVFQSSSPLGWWLILPLALAVQRLTGRRLRVPDLVLTGLVVTGLVLTLTRSAVLGGVVAALWVLLSPRVPSSARLRAALLIAVALLLTSPFLPGSSIVTRSVSAFNGADKSTSDHQDNGSAALDQIGQHPFGAGLGTGPATGFRFGNSTVTAENAYLQLGAELGVLPAVVFTALTVAVLMALRRAARAGGFPLAVAGGFLGVAIAGLFLDPLIDFATSLTLWAFAGLALPTPSEAPP